MAQDHRQDIFEARDSRLESIREALESGDVWEYFLEVEAFVNPQDSERRRVEFLLGCGGPTTRITVDQYDGAEFYHSWGKDSTGQDCTECELGWDDREMMVQLADEYCELMGYSA